MIKSVELKNFKAFKKSGTVDIRKVNIFVGANSSGKSSFIQSLLLLKNYIDSKEEDKVFCPTKGIGTYKTLVYNNNLENKIGYKITFSSRKEENLDLQDTLIDVTLFDDEKSMNSEHICDTDEITCSLIESLNDISVKEIEFIIKLNSDGIPVVDEFKIISNKSDEVTIYLNKNSYQLKLNNDELEIPDIIVPFKFYFKVNKDKIKDLSKDSLEIVLKSNHLLEDLNKKAIEFSKKLIYIESLRSKIERAQYIHTEDSFRTVGTKGENTLNALLGIDRVSVNEDKSKEEIKGKINYWLNEFDLGDNIDIKKSDEENYSIVIRNKNLGIYNNISDVGIGTSQLLPIIVESVNSPRGSTIIIEEPETHIHPKAQSKLSDLFVDCSKNDDKKFFIETHSIFLVTQLQILVSQGKISPEDVRVYYFIQDKDGSRAINMNILENGQFEQEWPSGFFDIHYELGKKLFESM
ncbi:hypothetical protein CLPU_26c00110 [Gottschalkia purinilytica]|uniref:AAA domain-containing protein n=1 Tax=Gottschalkia purinilytica TaxID=1503 RepID=A0A0L0W6H0_GOTPU|nr:DUF3696 domain-containing protein [Gottschalkia purinilytica]KNF07086.1 hypothetical protein CLPU_26c00110 [Gottschalkia purinilytica]